MVAGDTSTQTTCLLPTAPQTRLQAPVPGFPPNLQANFTDRSNSEASATVSGSGVRSLNVKSSKRRSRSRSSSRSGDSFPGEKTRKRRHMEDEFSHTPPSGSNQRQIRSPRLGIIEQAAERSALSCSFVYKSVCLVTHLVPVR
ncbi:hypothetical protein CSKR_203269 [Clonorchis sinensis]|uniref:Uncharacterized protein n=1 Tax=Clonorchis sinensis TaxID=79923 RepID=A0A8T1M895_CLOSI|nr:hypothetical protein CSKR_203269 [Clonorchis sinensis]